MENYLSKRLVGMILEIGVGKRRLNDDLTNLIRKFQDETGVYVKNIKFISGTKCDVLVDLEIPML